MRFLSMSATAIAIIAVVSCGPRYERLGGYAQGGAYMVTYNSTGADLSRKELQAGVDSLLYTIDTTFSGYNSKSQLSRYNRGELENPSPLFDSVFRLAKEFCSLTGGAVNAGAAPLFDIWGFGFANDSLPSAEKVQRTLEQCNDWHIINYNSFAQGLSCDLVAGYLRSHGVTDMLVDIGEIYCSGHNPRGKGWTVGVDNPRDGNESPGSELRGIWDSNGVSCGIVTSGNYRKYYIADGVKYAHTIDPRTGYPVTHNLQSATIVAPTSALADALATYCMVVGFDSAREFIESRPDIQGYLISEDLTWASDGFTFLQ